MASVSSGVEIAQQVSSELSPQAGRLAALDNLYIDETRPPHIGPNDDPTLSRLCTWPLLEIMVNDYMELLYPIMPVVHRPTFQRDLLQRRDLWDIGFSNLLTAMCATVVASVPSRFKKYELLDEKLLFSSRTEMVHRCYDILHHSRSPDYFDTISIDKWATSYLIYQAYFHIGQYNRARMLGVETMQLVRLLNVHDVASYSGLNYIEIQLRKKAFWLMFQDFA